MKTNLVKWLGGVALLPACVGFYVLMQSDGVTEPGSGIAITLTQAIPVPQAGNSNQNVAGQITTTQNPGAPAAPTNQYSALPEQMTPFSPDEAAKTMIVPEGFQVTAFAGEPDVHQPIAFCLDGRGRIWVAEAFNYPNHGNKPGDRILILEDTNGDGKADKRTVFYDKLNYVTGIEVGFGGVWVMSPPSLYFIPDKNGDDVPDSEPVVLLDGFGNFDNAHNVANGFNWGPDGWLYGTHGRTNWSKIGKPGTPDSERVVFDGGVYRYHPIRHVWEPFTDGTTNPWGIDWNDVGDAFVCNCVNPHLFNAIQGAHFEPWRNRDSSKYAYERINSIADHLHFLGGNIRAGFGSAEEDEIGGGHSHCGTMIYLGDNWPDKYRNQVFMNNVVGHRINNDLLTRKGSGYNASHAPDLMRSQDLWFVGVTLRYGPDGVVYVSDWSDTGECHSITNTQRQTGRMYRIAYGTPEFKRVDISKFSHEELVGLHTHKNEWYVRNARKTLQERHALGQDMQAARRDLHNLLRQQATAPAKLRALWTLHAIGGLEDSFLVSLLDSPLEEVQAWAIRLLCEDRQPPKIALDKMALLAANGSSQMVRLYIASALQRLPSEQVWPIARGLISRAEDAQDINLPYMDWYAIEPLVNDPARFAELISGSKIPMVRKHVARRLTELTNSEPKNSVTGLQILARQLATISDEAVAEDILTGMLRGLEGVRQTAMPEEWPAAYARLDKMKSGPVRELSSRVALVFGDQNATKNLKILAADKSQPADFRSRIIDSLVAANSADMPSVLVELLSDPTVQSSVVKGLNQQRSPDPSTPARLLAVYNELTSDNRQVALQTLASRPSWASDMLGAFEKGSIKPSDLSAFTARQIRSLGDDRLTERLNAIWGEVRTTPKEKADLIASLKARIGVRAGARAGGALFGANLADGSRVFKKACANCHRLFGEGGKIGPDLTGAQRNNIDYLLENIVDPSATVAKEYQMEIISTDDRIISGMVESETDMALNVVTATEKLVIPKSEVVQRKKSTQSMMPDGLLTPLTPDETRNLLGTAAVRGK